MGELALDCHVRRRQPMRRLGLEASIVADNILVEPVQHHEQVHSVDGLDHHLGRVNAPALIRDRGSELAAHRGPTRLQSGIVLPSHPCSRTSRGPASC